MGRCTLIRGAVDTPDRRQEPTEQVPPRGTRQDDAGGNEQTKFFISPVLTGSEPVKTGEMKN